MQSQASTVEEYIHEVPEDRREYFTQLRQTILEHIPPGFVEEMSYGMVGYVVPHSLYPPGYHCSPQLPLPFVSIASQKHFIGFYHMGLYGDNYGLDQWFVEEYARQSPGKLDRGKSCIRFKKFQEIPYKLIGELMEKITVDEWIASYDAFLQSRKK